MSLPYTVDQLLQRLHGGSVAAIEFRVGRSVYDHDTETASDMLVLVAYTCRPSWRDSRYVELQLMEVSRLLTEPAEALARELAHRLAVPLDLHTDQYSSSNWLSRQPSPPTTTYQVDYQATWWTGDGKCHSSEGIEAAQGVNGSEASGDTAWRLARRLGEGGQAHVRCGSSAIDKWRIATVAAKWPPGSAQV